MDVDIDSKQDTRIEIPPAKSRGRHDESNVDVIAKILMLISRLFKKGNISEDQRNAFKERVLEKSSSRFDLNVLLSEVEVGDEGPEHDVPAGSVHICTPRHVLGSKELNGVFLPRVEANFCITFYKMGNNDVTIIFNARDSRWEVVTCRGKVLCRVQLLSSEIFCLPADCPYSAWQFLQQGPDEVYLPQSDVIVSLLAPPDCALLQVVDIYRQRMLQALRDQKSAPSAGESNLQEKDLSIGRNEGITSEVVIKLSSREVGRVCAATLSAGVAQRMAARGISLQELDCARAATPRAIASPHQQVVKVDDDDDGDDDDDVFWEFVNDVRASNDYHSCLVEGGVGGMLRARLVGDDQVAGQLLLFALLQDSLEILAFPAERLLLPGGDDARGRERSLRQVVAQASRPPGRAGEPDDADVRVVLAQGGATEVLKCVQEKHLAALLSSLCPKLLCCGSAPNQLVVVMSHDCHSVLDVVRADDSSLDHPLLRSLQKQVAGAGAGSSAGQQA